LAGCINKTCQEEADGPVVVVGNRENRLLTPFPSDRMTLPDPTTRTGLRVDLPLPTDANQLETSLVQQSNNLDGFGCFAPLCVRFDRPIDLTTVLPGTVRLVNLSDLSQVPLDLGQGLYPTELAQQVSFFPNDPQVPSLLLKPGNRTWHYEDESNTLIIRPAVPLQPATRHVVLLSRRIRGTNGESIKSPENEPPNQQEFDDYVKAMGALGLTPVEVGFYWNFTTQSITEELETVRAGLDNEGSLSWLGSRFPPRVTTIRDLKWPLMDGDPYTFDSEFLAGLIEVVYQLTKILKPVYPVYEPIIRPYKQFLTDMGNVNYFVYGNFDSPNFQPTMQIDAAKGLAETKSESIPFMVSVPKPTAANNYAQPPYPVVVLGHGLSASRLQTVLMANRMAAQGLAVMCVDLVGHGPLLYDFNKRLKELPEPWRTLIRPTLVTLGLILGTPVNPFAPYPEVVDQVAGNGLLAAITGEGRAIDVDGDGYLDPAAAMFWSDFFRTRDAFRQNVVDLMQCVRVARNFGRDWNGNRKIDREEGDFNNDGIPDVGGPTLPITYSGMSLGSLLGGVLMGVDPMVRTAVLNVGGGGLADLMFRTSLLNEDFIRFVIRDVYGLAVVGVPSEGSVQFRFNTLPTTFWDLPASKIAQVSVRNKAKNRVESSTAGSDGAFSVVMLCDKDDPLEVTVTSKDGEVQTKEIPAPVQGLGLRRAVQRTREMYMLLEWFMERADAICYAPHWWKKPLKGVPEKRVLMQVVAGDTTVNVSSGMALARAAGLISPERMRMLVDAGIVRGENVNVDTYLPFESTQYRALRIQTGGSHAYLIGGSQDPGDKPMDKQTEFAKRTQDQMAIFLRTDGAAIPEFPIFQEVIPFSNVAAFKFPAPW